MADKINYCNEARPHMQTHLGIESIEERRLCRRDLHSYTYIIVPV